MARKSKIKTMFNIILTLFFAIASIALEILIEEKVGNGFLRIFLLFFIEIFKAYLFDKIVKAICKIFAKWFERKNK